MKYHVMGDFDLIDLHKKNKSQIPFHYKKFEINFNQVVPDKASSWKTTQSNTIKNEKPWICVH